MSFAKCRRLVAAELQVQARDRLLRIAHDRGVRIDEHAESRRERRKLAEDLCRIFNCDATLARREDETQGVRAALKRARRIVVGCATANLDAGQRKAEAAAPALIAPINSAGFSARMSVSPIKNPRAPEATSSRVSSAE